MHSTDLFSFALTEELQNQKIRAGKRRAIKTKDFLLEKNWKKLRRPIWRATIKLK